MPYIFLPFQVSEKQCGIKGRFLPVFMPSKNHVVRRFCASRNEEMRAVTRVMNKGHGVLKFRSGGERKTSFPRMIAVGCMCMGQKIIRIPGWRCGLQGFVS